MEHFNYGNNSVDQGFMYFGFIFASMIFTAIMYYHNLPHQRVAPDYKKTEIVNGVQNKPKRGRKYQFINSEEDEQDELQQQPQDTLYNKNYQKDNAQFPSRSMMQRNAKTSQSVLKKFVNFAYRYNECEHDMLKTYRNPQQIKKQTQYYTRRSTPIQTSLLVQQQSPQPTKKHQQIPTSTNPQTTNPQTANPQTTNPQTANPQTTNPQTAHTQINPSNKQVQPNSHNKQIPSNKQINPPPQPKINFIPPPPQNQTTQAIPPLEKKKSSQLNKQYVNKLIQVNQKNQQFKKEHQQNKQQSAKQNLFPTLVPQKSIKKQSNNQNNQPKLKINSSIQYLQAIMKYSDTFSIKTQIKTNINNLSGAKSDPRDLWAFATSYIKTINPHNHDEAVTFSFRIWQAVVHKFIKNTNIKDGFERIPPSQKSKQVQKNSINTYVILINIFRAMGHESIWLGIFGKTLRMLEFLLKRSQPLNNWKQLQLIDAKYVVLDGDVQSKYQSRIDFLTYFLLSLTTFDPFQFFQQVSQQTGQIYNFIPDLKKNKYQWSYRQFWCLIDTMKSNKLETYFKIPFWCNTLSVIYLQLLKNMKQGLMRQFVTLSKWIIKQAKVLTQKLKLSVQGKLLLSCEEQGPNGKFAFDGEEFVQGIIIIGKTIQTRGKETNKIVKWEEFRDKYSIFYYFWRKDTP